MKTSLRIVAIGGGTGLSALLRGLKDYPGERLDLTAIVAVTDDGGSSGRLRRDFAVLPPGDVRNCMVALSGDDALLSELFRYRFQSGRGLKGHSFGNLFLTALTHVTGDFLKAIQVSSEVLAIRGDIFPATSSNVSLEAEMHDGTRIAGESKISRSRKRIRRIHLLPSDCHALPGALEAIAKADLITLGPGSLFTSVIPNLLVSDIPAAIRRSRAHTTYFANLMWQPWETMHFSAADHLEAIITHAGRRLVDSVVVNTRHIGGERRRLYAAGKVYPVEVDLPRLEAMGVEIIARNLLDKGEMVRHNPAAAAEVAIELARRSRRSNAGRSSLPQS